MYYIRLTKGVLYNLISISGNSTYKSAYANEKSSTPSEAYIDAGDSDTINYIKILLQQTQKLQKPSKHIWIQRPNNWLRRSNNMMNPNMLWNNLYQQILSKGRRAMTTFLNWGLLFYKIRRIRIWNQRVSHFRSVIFYLAHRFKCLNFSNIQVLK